MQRSNQCNLLPHDCKSYLNVWIFCVAEIVFIGRYTTLSGESILSAVSNFVDTTECPHALCHQLTTTEFKKMVGTAECPHALCHHLTTTEIKTWLARQSVHTTPAKNNRDKTFGSTECHQLTTTEIKSLLAQQSVTS